MTEDDYGYTDDEIDGFRLQRHKNNLRKKLRANMNEPENENGE